MSDKQPTCAERIAGNWQSRKADLDAYYSDNEVYENGSEELGIGPFHDYGLGFDYVAPGTFRDQREGYWRFQISWGGPSDEIRFYGDVTGRSSGLLARAEYWFLDWYDGAHINVMGEDCVAWLFDWFAEVGSLEDTKTKSMEDWEEPDWWHEKSVDD